MDKNLFRELYVFELNRRDKLADTMNSLITGLAILGGFLGYLVENHPFSVEVPSILFVLLSAPALVFYGLAAYNAILYYHLRGQYQAIPTLVDLRAYYEDVLTVFYKQNPDIEGTADSAFENYLNTRYAEATDKNAVLNDYRGECQRKAFTALTYVLVLASLSAIPHLYLKITTKNATTAGVMSQEEKNEACTLEKQLPKACRRG